MTSGPSAIFSDDWQAREFLETLRWPHGPVCPRCGTLGNAARMTGKSTRPGVWKCRSCRKPFSVTVGTELERSPIGLSKWLLAMRLLSLRPGMSSHELHLRLGVTYKTARSMTRRIRKECSSGVLANCSARIRSKDQASARGATPPC